jgi:hypothetical protein
VADVLSIPVVCTSCADTDLPWWQVGILTVVACLIAYGLLWGVLQLLTRPRRRTAGSPPQSGSPPPAAFEAGGQPGASPPPDRQPGPGFGPGLGLRPGPEAAPPAGVTWPKNPYRTVAVNREQRYALEVDDRAGRYYVSFPVSNRMVDYEEAYEVDRATFDRYYLDLDSAGEFVTRCRNRELDHLLRDQPGADRGTPS